jgi:hypothetical protein
MFDIVALAKRINQRREESNRLHPDAPIRLTPAMSRILENDPDYLPYRERSAAKKQRPVSDPRVSTLVRIATALGTTVGDLLGEPWPLSPAEHDVLTKTIRVIAGLLQRKE